MTRTAGYIYSAEYNDAQVAQGYYASIAPHLGVQNTVVQTGDYGWAFVYNIAAVSQHAIVPTAIYVPAVARIYTFSFGGRLSAAPASGKDFSIIRSGNGLGIGEPRYLRVNDAQQFEVYDKGGTLRAGPTTHTVPTAGVMNEYHAIFDGRTLGTVWVSIFYGTTEILAQDTGVPWADFWWTDSSGDKHRLWWGDRVLQADKANCIFYSDDLFEWSADADGDAPHLSATPRVFGYGMRAIMPKANGTHVAWTGAGADEGEGEPYGDYRDVNEEPPQKTAWILTNTKGAKETYKWTDGNPLPDPCTIPTVHIRGLGRLGGAGKLGCTFMFRDASANEVGQTLTWPDTTWRGNMAAFPLAPDGGAWARADFTAANNMEYGVAGLDVEGYDTSMNIDALPGPEIAAYDSTIPTGNVTTPTQQRRIFITHG